MTAVAAPIPSANRLARIAATPRFARFASLVAVFAFWQFVVPFLPTDLIPSPARVAQFMWDEVRGVTVARATVWEAFGISLRRLAVGFLLAFAVGVPVGLMMGVWRALENFFQDFVVVGLAMPSLVWALLTGIWFGMGDAAPIVTVFLAAVPFVIINTFEGVRDVPRDLTDMAAAFGVGRSKTVRHVILASLMPFFFASLRYGLANGWKGLVLAEVFASTAGAGWTIQFWRDAHRAQGVFGYALFFVIFALILERLVFQRLARRVFRWRPEIGAVATIPEVAVDQFSETATDSDDEDR
jgi:NitT/TauT family transport system permease protein